MKKHIILSLAAVALVFTSCDLYLDDTSEDNYYNQTENVPGFAEPVIEEADNYICYYQYQESTIVLTDEVQEFVERVENDTVVYFSKETPKVVLPDVGNCITSTVTDKFPQGIGTQVIERTQEGGLYRCVTTKTPLKNIFKELFVNAHLPLNVQYTVDAWGNMKEGTYLAFDGAWNIKMTDEDRVVVPLSKPIEQTRAIEVVDDSESRLYQGVDIPLNVADATVNASGALGVGLFLDIDFDIVEDWYDVSLGAEIKTSYIADTRTELDRKIELNRLNLVMDAIPVGPIVIVPEGGISGGLRVKSKGSTGQVSGGFEKMVALGLCSGMMTKKEGFYWLNSDLIKSDAKLSIESDAQVGPYFGIGINCGIFAKGYVPFSVNADFDYGLKSADVEDLYTGNAGQTGFTPAGRNKPLTSLGYYVESDGMVSASFQQMGLNTIDYSLPMSHLQLFTEEISMWPEVDYDQTYVYDVNAGKGLPPLFTCNITLKNEGYLAQSLLDISPYVTVTEDNDESGGVVTERKLATKIQRDGENYQIELQGLQPGKTYRLWPNFRFGDWIVSDNYLRFSTVASSPIIRQ